MPILLKLAVLITGFLLTALTTAQFTTTTTTLEAVRVHNLESKTDFMNCGLVASEQVTSKLHYKVKWHV